MAAQEQGQEDQKPSFLERVGDFLEADQKKWGGMTPSAMWRLGLAELREAFSMGGNIAQPTPYGMAGTLTPGEVGAARQDDPQVSRMEEEPHTMADKRPLPSPSEIADDNRPHAPERDRGNVYGPENGHATAQSDSKPSLPSPSEIADDNRPYSPEQQHGHEREHHHGR